MQLKNTPTYRQKETQRLCEYPSQHTEHGNEKQQPAKSKEAEKQPSEHPRVTHTRNVSQYEHQPANAKQQTKNTHDPRGNPQGHNDKQTY